MKPTSFREYEASLSIPREVAAGELSTEQAKEITRMVFMPHGPTPAEVLFVFGSVQADWVGLAQDILSARYQRVVLAGRLGPTYFESGLPIAEYMRGKLLEHGVDPSSLLIQAESDNTFDDVRLSLPLIGEAASITFAAKAHHSGRCQRTLRRFFPVASLSAHLIDAWYGDVVVREQDWTENAVAVSRVMGEHLRILKYAQKGDISVQP